MRNPNGYGTIIKMSGKRRRPYAARKTIGWTDKGYPRYKYVGYYRTRREALAGLAAYNANPYDLEMGQITFKDLYKMWYEERAAKNFADNTLKSLRSAYNCCAPLHDKVYRLINAHDMNSTCAGRQPIKALLHNLDKYAMEFDIITKKCSDFVTVEAKTPKQKTVFSEAEIRTLWNHTEDRVCRIALILIYTGLRINELLSLTWDNVKDDYLITGSKTNAGKNRVVPIHPRIAPLVTDFLNDKHYKKYGGFIDAWHRCMDALKMKHTIHECRHTCRSRLDTAGVRNTTIDLIMGHKNGSVGEKVYTHKNIAELKSSILKVT